MNAGLNGHFEYFHWTVKTAIFRHSLHTLYFRIVVDGVSLFDARRVALETFEIWQTLLEGPEVSAEFIFRPVIEVLRLASRESHCVDDTPAAPSGATYTLKSPTIELLLGFRNGTQPQIRMFIE